jgi:hypothetical protein
MVSSNNPSEIETTMSASTENSRKQNPPAPPLARIANGAGDDPTEALKHNLEATRLPAALKAQILAELPSPEEWERMVRELREQGGLSSEEFLASLDLDGPNS